MSIDFIAIDFETANRNYNSACAIGIAIVEDLEVKHVMYSLLNPGKVVFDAINIAIHGIRPSSIVDAPTLDDFLVNISSLFGRIAIVAHNAYFDMMVLKNSCYKSAYFDNFKYIDSVSMAKNYVEGSKSLENCASCFHIDMGEHHNAGDDAVTCAKIAIACIRQSGADNLGNFCFNHPNVRIHHFFDLKDNGQLSMPTSKHTFKNYAHKQVKPSDIKQTVECISKDSPLLGKNIVFTGELFMDRRDAMQLAVNAGAVVKTSVSRKTDYLIVGKQNIDLVGADGLSSKEEKAYDLVNSGKAHILIIGEEDFISLVGQEVLDL